MATSSLSYPPQEFTFKEVQLVVRETPSIPAKLEPFVGVRFSSSDQVFKVLNDLKSMDVETFLCLHLDSKNTIKALQVISIGSLGSSLVHPREVFRSAILNGAAGVIFAHNHPSGDPAPSKEDLDITRRLCEVGRLIGIKCLDHIIIGQGRYFSFADQGLMSGGEHD